MLVGVGEVQQSKVQLLEMAVPVVEQTELIQLHLIMEPQILVAEEEVVITALHLLAAQAAQVSSSSHGQ
jgi:hypothetical protein